MHIPEALIQKLRKRYPTARTISIPADDPHEVIFEAARCSRGTWSLAVAAISSSVPHYHNDSEESYRVIGGKLRLYGAGSPAGVLLAPLRRGEKPIAPNCNAFHNIPPKTIHWAEAVGEPATVLILSMPAWDARDHHIRTDVHAIRPIVCPEPLAAVSAP